MTRQAAPPAQRWLLFFITLLVAPWLGQGVARAYSVSVNPQSGPPGTTVNVTLSAFGLGCVVYFDGVAVAGDTGCEESTALVFDVPADKAAGSYDLRAVEVGVDGEVTRQTLTFRVTAPPTPVTTPTTAAPQAPATTAAGPDAVPEGAAGTATTRPGSSPTTIAQPSTTGAGAVAAPTSSPEVFAAGCPPRQVALMRFAVTPTRAPPAGRVSATTSWGSVGTCTGVRSLRVLFDGQPVTGAPPEAGTSGSFEITLPEAATTGSHHLSLVAADDFSVELASMAFVVDKGVEGSDVPLIVGLAVVGVALLLGLILAVRRRRKRKGAFVDDLTVQGESWDGLLDVPDIAAPIGAAPIGAAPIGGAPIGASPIGADPTAAVPVAGADATVVAAVVLEDDPTMPVVPLVVSSGRDGSFYLLERQNPHAPRQPNGKRGWYRTQRSTPVRGIVARTVDPHTAGAAASELATGETPASAHVVIDVDGALDLLPDDVVAVHRPGLDDAVLVMLLAGFGADPATDETIVAHAAAWTAAKMGDHAIAARLVDSEELRAGRGGLLSDDHDFPWHRIVPLEAPPEAPADAPAATEEILWADELAPGAGVPNPTPAAAWEDAPAAPAPVVEALPVPDLIAAPDPIAAVTDPTPAPAPTAAPDPIDVAGPSPAPAPPADPAPAKPSSPRALPTPDELIARAAGGTEYFLVENENPHATLRANGKHGWYYPTRYGGIRAVVLHSPGGGDTAQAVAARLATVDQPEAAHAVIDPDTIVDLLPDDATALHGVRSSSAALDLALAYDPARWGTDPAAEEALLVRAAAWAGVRAVRHGIPVRRITVDAWHAGQAGFAANGDVDPGPDFPWDRFLQLTAWVAGRVAASRPPLTSEQPATGPSETVRSGSQPT
jgi:hypothetical protein